MKWKTAISSYKDGEFYIRGVRLAKLVDDANLAETIFFILQGKQASKNQAKMLEAILISMVEHGIEVPSAFVARSVVSTGNSQNAAIAAGILAIGDMHGGAIEKAAFYFQSADSPQVIVERSIQRKERLPGYGHKVYKTEDHRTTALFKKSQELKLSMKYLNRAREIESELFRQTGKVLPLNVDGAVAAIISELGFNWRLGKAFFILGRLPGIIAHVEEECKNEKSYRRLDSEDVEYVGPTAI
ncbi:MAG: citryl-CoA lyase [Patescibacteria group bacterium]